jgi:tetratricopeptide (TPR) repeat protein
MRKKLLFCIWLLTPIGLLAYHYGPGQTSMARDAAASQLALASSYEIKEDWRAAMSAYTDALTKIPASDRDARWQVRLAQAKARMQTGELPEAINDLETLLTEMEKEKAPAPKIADVRANLAQGDYYAGWLMRLEGAKTEEWMVQVDNARQNFRLLSEDALKADPMAAKGHQENLEATIRLARMDLTELQGMPLPKNCQGAKNVSQKCRSQCECKSKKPAEKEAKDARGAGTGERPPGGS